LASGVSHHPAHPDAVPGHLLDYDAAAPLGLAFELIHPS